MAMETSDNLNRGINQLPRGAFGGARKLFGSKRRLIAPFVIATVLMSVVGLFMMVSDSLLTSVAGQLDFMCLQFRVRKTPLF
jgi:hypothetical protein